MALLIYHNPRCAKSRIGLKYLQSKTSDFIVIDYIKNGITTEELKEILLKMNIKPIGLIRQNEELYRKELKGKNFTDDEWLMIIKENPRLLQRPLIVGRHKAILGNPVENIIDIQI
jgi:arsenate reductase (glutaredoxin)